MPANKNALLRYKTIDNCLRNRYRRWTLNDLVEACSDALYDFEGRDEGVSVRTVQLDIQMMRSDKLGYNAPIEVYEHKYYRYSDPDYSITDLPMSDRDMELMNEAINMLRQFEDFDHFTEMSDIIGRLQDNLAKSKGERRAIVDFERNDSLKGLKFLNPLYNHIAARRTITVEYHSFKSTKNMFHTVYPYLLKEFNNRWWLFCSTHKGLKLFSLALDRMISIRPEPEIPFLEDPKFNPEAFFNDIVGVTRGLQEKPIKIRFIASKEWAPIWRQSPYTIAN